MLYLWTIYVVYGVIANCECRYFFLRLETALGGAEHFHLLRKKKATHKNSWLVSQEKF